MQINHFYIHFFCFNLAFCGKCALIINNMHVFVCAYTYIWVSIYTQSRLEAASNSINLVPKSVSGWRSRWAHGRICVHTWKGFERRSIFDQGIQSDIFFVLIEAKTDTLICWVDHGLVKQLVNYIFSFIGLRNRVQLYWPLIVPNRSQFRFVYFWLHWLEMLTLYKYIPTHCNSWWILDFLYQTVTTGINADHLKELQVKVFWNPRYSICKLVSWFFYPMHCKKILCGSSCM